ncbi:MAG: late competence development ComFB family protein [Leptospiraceae bacterium]|nr:late competence development ComFB family protein [Leptospiraceae bacterium]
MNEKNVIKLNDWTREIVNSVEDDLREELKKVIQENPNWGWEQLSIQDVFGCAINQLPPIYIKKNQVPIVKLSTDEIRNAIYIAMERVKKNPIHIPKEKI